MAICNADIGGYENTAVNAKNLDVFFTGIFTGTAGTESGDVLFGFLPKELLSGYPEFIKVGRAVSMIVPRICPLCPMLSRIPSSI